MTIKEIDNEIQKLYNLRRELEAEEREHFKENAKQKVGKCFKINGTRFVKIIDIPQVKHTVTHIEFNKYQFPAIALTGDGLVPFEEDTLFSAAWGEGHDYINTYEEITQEEFNTEFERRLENFKNFVVNI